MVSANGQTRANIDMSVLFAQEHIQFQNVSKRCQQITSNQGWFKKATTPVKLQDMLPWLRMFPDKLTAQLLIEGFSDGFWLPKFSGIGCTLVNNLKSVDQFSDVVYSKIFKEISDGRIAGPFSSPPFENFRISPLGIVPKKEKNSFRLIHHLSFPTGQSFNDQIDTNLSSVTYASYEDALSKLRYLGKGALMAKADIKSAFRLLPINPECFNSLGFFFDKKFYFDKCLPVGCSLSCFYFESFSSFLEWVVSVQSDSQFLLHYLDDFLFLGLANSLDCTFLLDTFFRICSDFGIPLAQEKTAWPSTCLEFLGITIDSELMEFRLPEEKINKLSALLLIIIRKKKVCLKEMQSLLGLLAFASRIMPIGKVFSRKLYVSISGLKSPFSHVRITHDMREDLLVWLQFLTHFNGKSVWQEEFILDKDFFLFTDAAGSCGFAAIWQAHWCADHWNPKWQQKGLLKNIVLLELFPIIVALKIWGHYFKNKRILIRTDNKGVMYAINCLTSKSPPVIVLLCYLIFKCLHLNIWLKAIHVSGKDNDLADSLSRFQMDRFFQLFPDADRVGIRCPPILWDLI